MVVETSLFVDLRLCRQETATKSFNQIYSMFIQDGGVIGTSFMKDASQLNKKEMQQRYPRDKSYLEDPEVQIAYIQGRTKIELTAEQKALYYNLRWIPSNFHPVIDVPKSEQLNNKGIEYRHPSQLDEIGLLSQVFIYTGDTYREHLLRKYCQTSRSVDTFEIDL